jgi:hypothetical protein
MLGYVEAGVAIPVRNAAELVAALHDPAAMQPSAAAREAFLADHFAAGPSAPVIADGVLELAAGGAGRTLR